MGSSCKRAVDVSPKNYREEALQEDWQGDPIRDSYEIELFHKAVAMDKPVLGICRGMQLINVALGGSLYQDIAAQVKSRVAHRDPELYDKLSHEIVIQPNTRTDKLYKNGPPQRKIISVHHQAVKELAADLSIEVISKKDGIIEAIRYQPPKNKKAPYVFGMQWHPEYQDTDDPSYMSIEPVMREFLQEITKRKQGIAAAL